MVACFYKSPLNRKVPPKETFPFKWKLIKRSHLTNISLKKLRLSASNKSSYKEQPFKKQIYI